MTGIQEAKTWDVSRQALEEITTRMEKVSTERRAAFEELCQIQARIDAHRESLGGRKKITGPRNEALIVEYRPCSVREAEPWKSRQGCATC